ncbi:MFS transporter [Glycocaulis alkaliphilus]|nr:MFS transporter [Glycocaulis alkaliphilus]GGB68960.1 MFS transporter [Glycocaulis alkaliphilus]
MNDRPTVSRQPSRRRFRPDPFWAYMAVVAAWFASFGLQTTLFPGVINFTLAESPARLGIAQAALTAPMLFLLPLTGVLAERADRRTLLLVFHGVAGVSAGIMAALMFAGLLSYEALVVYALVVGSAGAFVMPARDSAINGVTRVTQRLGNPLSLQRAIVFASLVQFGAQITGMGAGFLASYVGPAPLFAVQALILVAGGAMAMSMPRLPRPREHTEPVLTALVTGLRTVISSPVIWPMTLIMIAVGALVVGGGFFVIIPVLVRDIYLAGYDVLAGLMVTFWVGALFSNIILARMPLIERPGRTLMVVQTAAAFALGCIALPLPLPALFLTIFVWGLAGGVAMSLSRALVQENAPKRQIARVMSVYQLGLFGGMPAGAVIMGYVVEWMGPRDAALIPAAGILAVLIVIVLTTPILSVRRADPS